MTELNLHKHFNEHETLTTDVGDFTYKKSPPLGEGGNSFVLLFTKKEMDFAVKFLKFDDKSKISRFKDEYFCAMQIPSHHNVARSYHFDLVKLGDYEYFIIIMKRYSTNLHNIGAITNKDDETKNEDGWNLFVNLVNALNHLHSNHVIHRDIKPQNIFYAEDTKNYVIGDLGIAHFADDKFPKESKTERSDRFANYNFSAPEQGNSKDKITEAADIYSLGQVIQWYLTGSTIRGLDRTRFSTTNSPEKLKWLDDIVDICLKNNPADRFQSIMEIKSFIENKLKIKPPRDIWLRFHDFDDVIRASFPRISKVYPTNSSNEITRFFNKFNSECKPEEFWYMTMEGGDNSYQPLIHLDNNRWLFCNEVELDIEQLIVYRDTDFLYKNFFVLLVATGQPFDIVDNANHPINRNTSNYTEDAAVYWNGKYIDHTETINGYYDNGDDIIRADAELFHFRRRHLKKYAYIIVPQGTATSVMLDREPTERFLTSIVANSSITEESLKQYLDETRRHHSDEITRWN